MSTQSLRPLLMCQKPVQVQYLRASLNGIHPAIDAILDETYGCIIYQEQVMKLVQVVFGMSLGEADMVRRAIGKKDPELMAKMIGEMKSRPRSIDITDEDVEYILSTISKCSSYLFNKSHSAAYALTAYQTAYLKANYPLEFYCALLNSNIDQEKTVEYMREAKRAGADISVPDIVRSRTNWTIDRDKNTLIAGMAMIRGVGKAKFISPTTCSCDGFKEFLEKNRKLNKQVCVNIVKAGCFEVSPLWAIDYIEWFKKKIQTEDTIKERVEYFTKKGDAKKIKEWNEKWQTIPEPPAEYDTDIRVCRELQEEVLGMSTISLFSLYDDGLLAVNRKARMVLIESIKGYISKKGNKVLEITGQCRGEGLCKFVMTGQMVKHGKKIEDYSPYKFTKDSMVIISTTWPAKDSNDIKTYFMDDMILAKSRVN